MTDSPRDIARRVTIEVLTERASRGNMHAMAELLQRDPIAALRAKDAAEYRWLRLLYQPVNPEKFPVLNLTVS
jgi:hypothetical protein